MNGQALIELTNRLAAELVPPPEDAPDVCPLCRSWRDEDHPLCSNCSQTADQLGSRGVPVLPISLYCKPSALRDQLRLYKEGPIDDRAPHGRGLAAITDRFFLEHLKQLQRRFGPIDCLCIVPATKHGPSSPLKAVLEELPAEHLPPVVDLLARGPGTLAHRSASPTAFVAPPTAAGQTIVLIDDVYTTGATAQSAATALATAGASVKAIIPIGRRINPQYAPGVERLWLRQKAIPFEFTAPPFWSAPTT